MLILYCKGRVWRCDAWHSRSAGVLDEQAKFTLALPFNSQQAVKETFTKFKDQIACVIVEPVVGNMGCVPPGKGYLEFLRSITAQHSTVLIFDEVMTGFRVSFGGAQQLYKINPDLTTLGKIIGGGLPVGAYGGRAELMDMIAPLGPGVPGRDALGNPLAMAAGIATLRELKNAARNLPATRTTQCCSGGWRAGCCEKEGASLTANRVGSMFTCFFSPARSTTGTRCQI